MTTTTTDRTLTTTDYLCAADAMLEHAERCVWLTLNARRLGVRGIESIVQSYAERGLRFLWAAEGAATD